jgi:hypothetical protein
MQYSGTNSFFLRVLLDKKYALPYRVIDALVDHFTAFGSDDRDMPVVWHQALLCFVQRCVRPSRFGGALVAPLRMVVFWLLLTSRLASRLALRPALPLALRLPSSSHSSSFSLLPVLPSLSPCNRYKSEIRAEDKAALLLPLSISPFPPLPQVQV